MKRENLNQIFTTRMTTMTPIMAIERCRRTKSNTIKTHIMKTAAHADAAAVVPLNFATFLVFFTVTFSALLLEHI